MHALKAIGLAAMLLAASSCGLTYTSPSVRSAAQGLDIRIVALDPQTVHAANQSPYQPKALPAAFFQTAGPGALQAANALPAPPYLPTERPEALELRVPPPADPGPYRIGVGDVLLIAAPAAGDRVDAESGLQADAPQRQGYTVRDDGAIAIPDLAPVTVAGFTLAEAQTRVSDALVANRIDPAISLEVTEFNARKVVGGGAVTTPALLPLTLTALTLAEALAAAGGTTAEDAEFASIRLYRGGTLYQIPLETFLARPALQGLRLVDGDALYVDTGYDLSRALEFYRQRIDVINVTRTARTAALAELAQEVALRQGALAERRGNFQALVALDAIDRDYVYLAGEVATQTRVPLPFERRATLADVLFGEGGFDVATGDPARIYVLRAPAETAASGTVTAWHLDAANAAALTLATRFEMRPNDIVFVEEQPITSWNRALQQFFPTLVNTAGTALRN